MDFLNIAHKDAARGAGHSGIFLFLIFYKIAAWQPILFQFGGDFHPAGNKF